MSPPRKGIRGLLAVVMVALGLLGDWEVWRLLTPAQHTLSSDWCDAHTEEEYWGELQKQIRAGFWFHDDAFRVGAYGDKRWAEWIMNRVRPGQGMGCMGARYDNSCLAMATITNQDQGESGDAWLAWWQENKHKSQNEWIADGFRQSGLAVAVPPRPEDTEPLLTLLGADPPGYRGYNAFRCLRDSGFQPEAYKQSHPGMPEAASKGLAKYRQMFDALRKQAPPGPQSATPDACRPLILRSWVRLAGLTLFGLLAAGGACLLLFPLHRRDQPDRP